MPDSSGMFVHLRFWHLILIIFHWHNAIQLSENLILFCLGRYGLELLESGTTAKNFVTVTFDRF